MRRYRTPLSDSDAHTAQHTEANLKFLAFTYPLQFSVCAVPRQYRRTTVNQSFLAIFLNHPTLWLFVFFVVFYFPVFISLEVKVRQVKVKVESKGEQQNLLLIHIIISVFLLLLIIIIIILYFQQAMQAIQSQYIK